MFAKRYHCAFSTQDIVGTSVILMSVGTCEGKLSCLFAVFHKSVLLEHWSLIGSLENSLYHYKATLPSPSTHGALVLPSSTKRSVSRPCRDINLNLLVTRNELSSALLKSGRICGGQIYSKGGGEVIQSQLHYRQNYFLFHCLGNWSHNVVTF